MTNETLHELLKNQLVILKAASQVLKDSHARVKKIFDQNKTDLSIEEKESCEALTARFARLLDFLFQKLFRIIDRIELIDEGTALDRLNRMEKRAIIPSASLWKQFRELRNEIAHDYLIEQSDRILRDAFRHTPELLATSEKLILYVKTKGYMPNPPA